VPPWPPRCLEPDPSGTLVPVKPNITQLRNFLDPFLYSLFTLKRRRSIRIDPRSWTLRLGHRARKCAPAYGASVFAPSTRLESVEWSPVLAIDVDDYFSHRRPILMIISFLRNLTVSNVFFTNQDSKLSHMSFEIHPYIHPFIHTYIHTYIYIAFNLKICVFV
jgi:hypothetical protein